jgi:chromosome segregation protein
MTEQSDINNDIRFLEDKLATHQEKQSRLDGQTKRSIRITYNVSGKRNQLSTVNSYNQIENGLERNNGTI